MLVKKIGLIALLGCVLLLSAFLTKDDNECSILHKGTFTYAKGSVKVKIKGNSHTEYHNNGKYIIQSSIEWVNECEYNTTLQKVTLPNFPYEVGTVMNVNINKVVGKIIYYTASIGDKSFNGEFLKVK